MWNLKKRKKEKTKLTDIENRLVVGGGGRVRGRQGMVMVKLAKRYMQTSRYKISKSWDVMYVMVTTVKETTLHI